jgi:hypothetical protein
MCFLLLNFSARLDGRGVKRVKPGRTGYTEPRRIDMAPIRI